MSLSSVINIAQNSLANLTRQSSVLARNINDSNSPYYARREIQTVTLGSGAQIMNVRRATDMQLARVSNESVSASAGQSLLSERLGALNSLIAGEDGALEITDRLNVLYESVQTYGGNPNNSLLGDASIGTAKSIVTTLAESTQTLQHFRLEIDREIGNTVAELNALLTSFEEVNNEIKQGTQLGQDVNDALDRRAELLDGIAEVVPVSPLIRENNDMVILTMSGATLFETEPRSISFLQSNVLIPGQAGNPLYIDVVPLNYRAAEGSPVAGKLDGLLRLRDVIVPKLQNQLDETARSLLNSFSETDVTGGGLPAQVGLFTWSGGPSLPLGGTVIAGLASQIKVNPAYDPEAGGNSSRLRDGGANGAGYNANPSNSEAYADRLINLVLRLETPNSFDPAAGIGTDLTVVAFSARSSAWLSGQRSSIANAAELSEAKLARVRETLSNQTGVNVDMEMIKLGELENGYQASARLLNVADQMLQTLLDAVN